MRETADGRYARLAAELRGGGVPDIESAARDMGTKTLREAFRELVHPAFLRWLAEKRAVPGAMPDPAVGDQVLEKAGRVRSALRETEGAGPEDIARFDPAAVRRDFEAILRLPMLAERFPRPRSRKFAAAAAFLHSAPERERPAWSVLFCWAALRRFDKRLAAEAGLRRVLVEALRDAGMAAGEVEPAAAEIFALANLDDWAKRKGTIKKRAAALAAAILADDIAKRALGVNEYQGVVYFSKEAFERMLWDLFAVAAIGLTADPAAIVSAFGVVGRLLAAAQESGYRVDSLLKALESA